MKTYLKLSAKEQRELKTLEKNTKTYKVWQRTTALRMKSLKFSNAQIAQALNVHTETVSRWIRAYIPQRDVNALKRKFRANLRQISKKEWQEIIDFSNSLPFEDIQGLQDAIFTQYKIRYSVEQLQKIMQKMGAVEFSEPPAKY